MERLEFIATAAFGLEAIVARELTALGYTDLKVEDGKVRFWSDLSAVCRCNLWLRSADRVQIVLGEFDAFDFDALFDQTKQLPWEDWLPVDAKFPVYGRSIQSQLHGVPVCQKMIKKAIVERLKTKHQRAWFQETGPQYEIDFLLLRDRATLTLDTTGDGLHKRGYRPEAGIAPLKETLAAALIELSYWNRERLLVDPCCGSGTIPIEAAMMARNIAPGSNRHFSSEGWNQIPAKLWADARKEARDLRLKPLPIRIWGSDIDRRALDHAKKNAADAGVLEDITFTTKTAGQLSLTQEYSCLITNPPYGERMGERNEVDQLNRDLGAIARSHPTWSTYILTSHPLFERQFGRPADRRRKLYNGRIECTYFQYYGPKPPRDMDPNGIAPMGRMEADATAATPVAEASGFVPNDRNEVRESDSSTETQPRFSPRPGSQERGAGGEGPNVHTPPPHHEADHPSDAEELQTAPDIQQPANFNEPQPEPVQVVIEPPPAPPRPIAPTEPTPTPVPQRRPLISSSDIPPLDAPTPDESAVESSDESQTPRGIWDLAQPAPEPPRE
jgi:putative N6-adenine-specific DNA methylase